MPDVVLVRKHYPKYRKKKHDRTWKLKSIAKDTPDVPGIGVGLAPDTEAGKRDLELFMRALLPPLQLRRTPATIALANTVEGMFS